MNKIPGYDEAQAFEGGSSALPAGKYICEIKGAKVTRTTNGKEQLTLQLDIAEGDYKGYYSDRYAQNLEKNGNKAKWANGGLFRQGWEGKSLPFFKGMITCIEKCNDGYKWDWDEKKLKGKRIGVLFGREQFIASDGQKKWATKAVAVRSFEGLEKSEIPKDKLLDGSAADTWNSAGFDDMEEASEDDLPF